MAPHPGVDTEQIREKARKDILDLLEGVRGKKNLVIDQSLAGPTSLFVKFSNLQQYGVDKVFFLENNNVDTSQRNVVFLTRGESADRPLAIAEQIQRLQQSSQSEHEFTVFVTPRKTLVCSKIFEDTGVLGDIVLDEFPLYFLPLDPDLLSLELEDSFSNLYLRKDPTCVFLAAKALMLLQDKYGLFPRIIGKGDNSQRLMELLFRMRSEASAEERASTSKIGMMPSATIESLIIIDREVDFGSAFLTQLTYEGLIDEMFGIKDNQAELDTSIVGPSPGQQGGTTHGTKRKILLDSSDTLYEQLRDSNFATVGPSLNKVAKRLASDYESRHSKTSTAELREFVNKLSGYQAEHQSLKIHTGLAEEIIKHTQSEEFDSILKVQQNLAAGADPSTQHDTIEELIARGTPLSTILRLLCLESCTAGGLRPKDFEHFRLLILQAYGYQHVLTLDALEKMQLLVPRASGNVFALPAGSGQSSATTKTNYNYLRKALRLIVDEVNEQDPNDIAYVYSGYAPLSIRLVQCVLQKQYLLSFTKSSSQATSNAGGISTAAHGWQGFEDALKATKGQTFNKVQKGEESATKARAILSGTGGKKTVVVMFLGGITRAEIAALRFLEKGDPNRKILVCTTSVTSGGKMIDAAIEKRTFGAVESEEAPK
ncbi:hypothetical protein MMC10_009022 [Thelotrema lepadinum]|nr:hypothetical protein [Thelotrema lepadinum]